MFGIEIQHLAFSNWHLANRSFDIQAQVGMALQNQEGLAKCQLLSAKS